MFVYVTAWLQQQVNQNDNNDNGNCNNNNYSTISNNNTLTSIFQIIKWHCTKTVFKRKTVWNTPDVCLQIRNTWRLEKERERLEFSFHDLMQCVGLLDENP